MSKPATEISPKRALRVKEIIEREKAKNKHFTQAHFADEIAISPVTLTRIINKKSPLTERVAKDIIEKFPEYRLEWLLGYDNVMTDSDWLTSIQDQRDTTAQCIWGIIEASLNKKGLSLKFYHRQGQHLNSTERFHSDCYYGVVDNSGKERKKITPLEMREIEQKIEEYADFISEKYLVK